MLWDFGLGSFFDYRITRGFDRESHTNFTVHKKSTDSTSQLNHTIKDHELNLSFSLCVCERDELTG